MQIGVVGINHKLAPVALREAIAKACTRRFSLGNPLADCTFILLSTCNRCELYFYSENLSYCHEQILTILKEEMLDDFEQKLYTFFGLDCFLHLAKVTAGLDSAIIAETEIQGQVKTAYEQAASQRTLAKDQHFLFQKCLKIAKEVRREHLLTCQLPDLEHALFWFAKEYFQQDALPAPLFIGASEINLKIARFFEKKGIQEMHLANRTPKEPPANLSQLSWTTLEARLPDFSWVIAATKSPHYILNKAPVSRKKTLLVDLAVPRNIDPALDSADCKVLNIDDLNLLLEERKALLATEVKQAEQTLTTLVKRSIALFRTNNSPLPLALIG